MRADIARSLRDRLNTRQGRVADGMGVPDPTAPPAPGPDGYSPPPIASHIPSRTPSIGDVFALVARVGFRREAAQDVVGVFGGDVAPRVGAAFHQVAGRVVFELGYPGVRHRNRGRAWRRWAAWRR